MLLGYKLTHKLGHKLAHKLGQCDFNVLIVWHLSAFCWVAGTAQKWKREVTGVRRLTEANWFQLNPAYASWPQLTLSHLDLLKWVEFNLVVLSLSSVGCRGVRFRQMNNSVDVVIEVQHPVQGILSVNKTSKFQWRRVMDARSCTYMPKISPRGEKKGTVINKKQVPDQIS